MDGDPIVELGLVAGLRDLSSGDGAEQSAVDQVNLFLQGALDYVESFIRSHAGMQGEAGQSAVVNATSIRSEIEALQSEFLTWDGANVSARAVMREAGSHAGELAAEYAAAQRSASMSPDEAAAAQAAAAAAQAKAQAILDHMNDAVEAAIPSGAVGIDPSLGGELARRKEVQLPDGSGWGGLGGGAVSAVSGWVPLAGSRFDLSGPGDPGILTVGDPNHTGGSDPTGLVVGAGLVGAAAVAAAIACGAGSASALPSLGAGALTVAPVGGIYGSNGPVAPAGAGGTTGMVPGMGGGAGSGSERGKKRRGYKVQHIDTAQGPVDPGWGALAGSVDTMPPLPEPEEDWW